MNKKEFIKAIAENENFKASTKGISEAAIEKIINTGIDIIIDTVSEGDDVQFVGFGTFTQSERAERTGHNPRTKEPITIAACKTPRFKAGKLFKDALK